MSREQDAEGSFRNSITSDVVPAASTADVLDEEAALEVFAELLDVIRRSSSSTLADAQGNGLFASAADFCVASSAQVRRWQPALKALSHSIPLNGMLAETLLECVNGAFAEHICAFQTTLQQAHQKRRRGVREVQLSTTVVSDALSTLCAAYDHIFPPLWRWCAALGVPGVAALFSVRVRCALLQADLISGEEPRQKQAFFAFLRQHGRELLSRGPESRCSRSGSSGDASEAEIVHHGKQKTSAAGSSPRATVTDPIIVCLHRLTLSESNEVKRLWRSVLEARIREKLRDLSDDFSTHFLHAQMVWLERCVMPFVAMVLDGSSEHTRYFSDTEVGEESIGACETTRRGGGGRGPAELPSQTTQAEQEAWGAEMRHLFLRSYARRRLDSFWEILSDYPDSIPALEDMHYCLQANPESGLKTELMHTVRRLLSTRLHRAGTRTEDILAILINTIHAFCVLFPRNEQNSVVFAVIADTLEHLRRRKDCVTAIVQAVMQPGSAMHAAAAAPPPQPPSQGMWSFHDAAGKDRPMGKDGHDPSASAAGAAGGGVDLFDGLGDSAGGSRDGELYRTGSRDRPDVLRVLLTAIPRRALVEEYQHVLAAQLLQKPMHGFDTTPEEEVLERLKQVFGETVLDRCAVMVRDLQMSRRITQQLREQLTVRQRRAVVGLNGATAAAGAALVVPPASCSVSVLSMTTWPPLAQCAALPPGDGVTATATAAATTAAAGGAGGPPQYRPHPSLQAEMDALAEAYKRLKDNQRLAWLPSLGRVELELTQLDPAKGNAPVVVLQTLSLFDASVVLFVKEMSSSKQPVALSAVAAALEVTADVLRPHVRRLSPAVLVMPSEETVAMQLAVGASSDFVFAEDTAGSEAEAKPAGLAPERVKLMERMVTSLLKTRGPQAGTAIHASLKLLAKFEGTNADLLELLQSFIKRGLVVLNDAKLYALPPK